MEQQEELAVVTPSEATEQSVPSNGINQGSNGSTSTQEAKRNKNKEKKRRKKKKKAPIKPKLQEKKVSTVCCVD